MATSQEKLIGVPAADVEQVMQDFRDDGATFVEKIAEGTDVPPSDLYGDRHLRDLANRALPAKRASPLRTAFRPTLRPLRSPQDSPISAPMPTDVTDAPLKGAALIKDEVKRLPDRPGVYRMVGDEGEVLYVGKARSLKKRVVQYAQGRFHTQRIAHMVDLTRSMEFVTTRTETDALLLEINLIKQLKPRFNVLLRDDKSFPEIVIRREHPAAQLRKHRGAHTIKGDYFGPFASAGAVTARSIRCRRPSFCGPAPTASTRAAPAPACCTRSAAARRPAQASSAWRTTAPWWTRPATSCAASPAR